MSLYLRNKLWWVKLPNPDKDGPPIRKPTRTRIREQAEVFEKELKAKLKANGEYLTGGSVGMGHLMLLDKKRAEREHQNPDHLKTGILHHWRMIMAFFEDGAPDKNFDPSTLTADKLEEFRDFCIAYGHRPQTYKRYFSTLKRGLSLGCRKYKFAMPVADTDWPKFKSTRKDNNKKGKLWDKELIERYLNLLKPDCRDELIFLAFTAIRAEECKKIEPDMIRKTNDPELPGEIVLPDWLTKKRAERTIGLVPEAMAAVERQLGRRDPSRKQLWAKSRYRNHIKRISQKVLGLPCNITRRDLRHSYMSTALKNGADLKALMEAGGHKTLAAAELYQSSTPERTRNVALAYVKDRQHVQAQIMGTIKIGDDSK